MFSIQTGPEVLAKNREDFPVGFTVEAVEFHDRYRNVPAGTRGHVFAADDCGTVHCSFENDVNLGCIWSIDAIQRRR